MSYLQRKNKRKSKITIKLIWIKLAQLKASYMRHKGKIMMIGKKSIHIKKKKKTSTRMTEVIILNIYELMLYSLFY